MPKRGFPRPCPLVHADRVRPLIELLLGRRAAERGIFQRTTVESLWRRNLRSRTDTLADYARANRLYSIALVELWFRVFLDGDSRYLT
jgi:hypothetical protein